MCNSDEEPVQERLELFAQAEFARLNHTLVSFGRTLLSASEVKQHCVNSVRR